MVVEHPIRTTHQLRALRQSTPALSVETKLLGRYESPGMTDERFLVRRSDGQVILLTLILYVITTGLDEHHNLEQVAHDVSERIGKTVSVYSVAEVIDIKLKPLGILAAHEPVHVEVKAPLLSLTMRGVLVPRRAVHRLARLFRPLYWPASVVVALVGPRSR